MVSSHTGEGFESVRDGRPPLIGKPRSRPWNHGLGTRSTVRLHGRVRGRNEPFAEVKRVFGGP